MTREPAPATPGAPPGSAGGVDVAATLPYRVDEGVKRAKAALLLGHATVRGSLMRADSTLDRPFDVPIAGLLSRRNWIDRSTAVGRARWDQIWHGMRHDPAALPKIVVVRSARDVALEDVTLFPSLSLVPPGPPPSLTPPPSPPPP